MTMLDTAELLVRIGAILGIVFGIIAIVGSVFSSVLWFLGAWSGIFSFFGPLASFVSIGFAIVSIILSFIVLTKYVSAVKEGVRDTGIILIIFGILIGLGAWGIGGLLILVGGILILVEKGKGA